MAHNIYPAESSGFAGLAFLSGERILVVFDQYSAGFGWIIKSAYTPILIVGYSKFYVNEYAYFDILNIFHNIMAEEADEIEKFGIGRDEMMRQVLTKTHSALSTLYYLLLDHLIEVRRQYRKGATVTSKRNLSSSAGAGLGSGQFNVIVPSTNTATSSSAAGANRPSSAGEVPTYMHSTQSKQIRDTIVIGSNPQATGGDGYARPRSASAGRPSAQGTNRPSSAYAGRMRINIV